MRTLKIAVVDGNDELRMMLELVLQRAGYQVITYRQADLAWPAFKAGPQDFDLLITGVIMTEGMTGLELCQVVKMLRPEIRVIVMSGQIGEGVDLQAKEAKADAFLQKPFRMQVLLCTIDGLFQS